MIAITDPYGGIAERNYDAQSNLVGGIDRDVIAILSANAPAEFERNQGGPLQRA